MFDIITFGAAFQDIYLNSEKFLPKDKTICLPLGAKIEIKNIFLTSGGGGTNAAATFANQGFKTAYCGMVGDDDFGKSVIKNLKQYGINTSLVKKTKMANTSLSVILMQPGNDRTILVHRGASDLLIKKDIPWDKIKKTKWVYLAPFSGELAKITEELINFAKKNKIKVAFNPGYNQLSLEETVIQRILKGVDVLILNQEEASLLTKIPYQEEKEIFKKIDELTPGIAIMTKGTEGVAVSDGKHLYCAKSLDMKLVDGTGAGDAFGAGFVSGLLQKNDVNYAIQLAMANASFAITKIGAKEGILKKNQSWPKTEVLQEKCS